jgi:hypothetical protein
MGKIAMDKVAMVQTGIENTKEFERKKEEFVESLEYVCDNKRHLVCRPYSFSNLAIMADDLGLKRHWFHKDHYDIPVRRMEEIMDKCTIVSSKEIVEITGGRNR